MARSKKSKPTLDFARYMPCLVFFAVVLNGFLIWRFESSRKPQVVYCVRDREITNSVQSVQSVLPVSLPSVPGPSSSNSVSLLEVDYDYFLFRGSRHVRLWDRYFSEGSLLSYGRISRIFPDRIFLEDGNFITNSKYLNNKKGGSLKNAN